MKLLEGVTAATSFRTWPNTVLLILIYIVVFASVFITDELPDVPKKTNRQGLNLDQAMQDLHYITTRPHPYNSHSNDEVRSYLLGRIRNILLFAGTHANAIDEHDPQSYANLTVPSYARLSNDLYSNGSWAEESRGVYFEGTNILVKIQGTEPELRESGGVLFSAHYDSVSTAPGVTDDGMAVATLLQLIKWYASQEGRPRRTVVFNLNNGEEDWLNGAHAYLEHPWSKITDTFINLEGAASGGRPILFRATSTKPLRAFHVPHPHANVFSADAFARGVIRSGTDYSVYTTPLRSIDPSAGPGPLMQGMDIAFYKGRSRYHTKYDAIPWLEGGKKAMWAMMELAKSAGDVLANEEQSQREIKGEAVGDGEKAVYFDLFGSALVLFRLQGLLTFNIVTLIVGPILLALLLLCASVVQPPDRHERERRYNEPSHEDDDDSLLQRTWIGLIELKWVRALWMWGKFWIALGLGVGAQALLIYGYTQFNPFIVYSHPYLVLLTTILLTFITHTSIFSIPGPRALQTQTHSGYGHGQDYGAGHNLQPQAQFPQPLHEQGNDNQQQQQQQQQQQPSVKPSAPPFDPDQEKQVSLWQTYLLSWILLLLSTLAVAKADIGGLYVFSIWNLLIGTACIIGIVQHSISPTVSQRYARQWHGGDARDRQVRFHGDDRSDTDSDSDRSSHHQHQSSRQNYNTTATERTPLIPGRGPSGVEIKEGEEGAIGWWLAQLLLVVPIPLILVAHLMVIVVDAVPQTLSDGSSAVLIYSIFAGLSFLLILPLAPFASRIHKGVVLLLALVFAIVTAYNYTIFPFSTDDPLKIYFQQKVELDLGLDLRLTSPSFSHLNLDLSNTSSLSSIPWSQIDTGVRSGTVSTIGTRAITSITGAKYFVKKKIVPKLPSAREADGIVCDWDLPRQGLYTCAWESQLLPQPGDGIKRVVDDQMRTISTTTEAVFQDINKLHSSSSESIGPNPETIYLTSQISRRGRNSARFRLTGTNTRSCRIYFDNRPILSYFVHGGQVGMQPGYLVPEQGLKEIRLWSRTWGREFVVDVNWGAPYPNTTTSAAAADDDEESVQGRVAFEWNEYESASVGHYTGGKIPALEEVFGWLPKWAAVTKASDGLVEVWAPFEL